MSTARWEKDDWQSYMRAQSRGQKSRAKPKPVLPPEPIEAMCPKCGEFFNPQMPTILSIAQEVAKKHNVSLREMRGPRRHKYLVAARQEAMLRAYRECHRSLPVVGRFFGNRDHSTVLHAVRKLEGNPLHPLKGTP